MESSRLWRYTCCTNRITQGGAEEREDDEGVQSSMVAWEGYGPEGGMCP